jgi:hypothetical protein
MYPRQERLVAFLGMGFGVSEKREDDIKIDLKEMFKEVEWTD